MSLDEVREHLHETWVDEPGVPGFLATVDHKRIGKRYLVTAFAFFVLGGVQALLMRSQLAVPANGLVDAETYNRLFTMHGTTMIFLFNTPVLSGFGNYLLPLQIGARDMAFPKLNAVSYWIYLLSGAFIYASFFVGQVPDAGWFAYVPLATDYSPGLGMSFWSIGVVFLGVSTTAGGINFIVTFFKMRAPGMSISRIPLFSWSILVMAFMIVFALPAITLGPLLMAFDRILGTHFYDPALGGDAILYQHLFWFWGHPEVYILFIPATGMLSTIIPTFARRPIAGYAWAVAALLATGFVSFGVWVHHMFAVGLPDLANSFFSLAGLGVTFPTAVQFFLWIATLWTGKVVWGTPLAFSLGAVLTFLMGGITGVMVSIVPFDWQAHDSYFVVAHLHYVLIGGVVFPIFASLYYWWPKVTGYLLGERLGYWSCAVMLVGFHVTFFPMHALGLVGMTRRVYTFAEGLGWDGYNLVATVGAFVFAAGVALTAVNVVVSRVRRTPAGPNPWQASTLEWATTSPPQEFNFYDVPLTASRDPLWEEEHPEGQRPVPGGLALDDVGEHETVATAGLDARMQSLLHMPHPSYWPFLSAVALLAVSVAFLLRNTPLLWAAVAALTVTLLGWHLPEAEPTQEEGP